MIPLRPAAPQDLPALAALWHQSWHAAHDPLVPAGLIVLRSRDSFARRLGPLLPRILLAEDAQGLTGFCAITPQGRGTLDQLFVAPRARGTGLAVRLLRDGEARLAAAGCTAPLLRVIVGNARALAFYRREGWAIVGPAPLTMATSQGNLCLDMLALEKSLGLAGPATKTRG